MTNNEMKEILGLAMRGASADIEKKCELISKTFASYSSIEELNILIQHFFEIREKWNTLPYDDKD